MQKEFETQVLDIDPEEIAKKLRKLGAKEEPEKLQKRWVYDINPDGCHEWIRLRTDGGKTTICYKLRKDASLTGTTEIEVETDDFDKAAELLGSLKFYFQKFYQEDKKTIFNLDDIEFKIDKWPLIPPVLEIEAKSEAGVARGLELLGLTGKEFGHHGYVAIFKKYGYALHEIEELKFDKEKND